MEFVKQHTEADFQDILDELVRRPMAVNLNRLQAGKGRSQAFGIIRRWSYRPWLSRNTWMRPKLWCALQAFADSHVTVEWDAVQVNDNYHSAPHKDKGNCGDSYIVGFGEYTGGHLCIDGANADIRHRGHLFNGSELRHWTAEWTGHRYSLVFFRIVWPEKFGSYSVTSRLVENGTEVTDSYDDSVVVLDKRGRVVQSIRQGQPRPWIGRLTSKGQKSRTETPPQAPPSE
jgi:hypothetical protein